MSKEEIQASVKKQLGFDVEGIDLKSEIQGCVVNSAHPYLILNWATRTGKSRPSLKICSTGKSICFTPQELLHQTLQQEAMDANIDISTLEFACYASSHKYIDEEYDVLWLDEGHSVTDRNIEHFASMKVKRIIITSGTIPEDKLKLLYQLGKPKILRITIEDGINWKLISPPKIYVIDKPLNQLVFHTYIKGADKSKNTIDCSFAEWNKTYKWLKGIKRPNCRIRCNEVEYYQMLESEFEMFKWAYKQKDADRNRIEIQRKQMGSRRKAWLNSIKTEYAKQICSKLKGKRFIVFANNIEQCNLLANGKTTIHSQNNKKDDAQAILDFNNGIIDELYTVNKVDAGITLYDFDAAVHVSLSGSEIQPLQRQGRSLASDFPILYIIRVPKTKDDDFFQEFKKSLDDSYFNFITLKDI